MKTKSLLVLLLMAISFSVFAQNYTFKVLVNKGRNEMKSGSAWQTIKVGSSLKENDEIKVGSNAYVGLVHASGKPIELKEPKTYKVADLAKQFSGGSSVVAKYTDFILSSNEDKKNKLAATGAVHRGLGELNVYLPTISEQTFFFNDTQLLGWDNSQIKGPYRVTFTSLFDDELKVVTTPENFVL